MGNANGNWDVDDDFTAAMNIGWSLFGRRCWITGNKKWRKY